MEIPASEKQLLRPALYLVGTPLGNLEDITLRALRTLEQSDVILTEDTRTTSVVLKHFGIHTPLKSYRVHREKEDIMFALDRLRAGEAVCLCSEAGMPGVSDPGSRLVQRIREELPDVPVYPVPGPSALSTALSVCGWQANPCIFGGFLSVKPGKRRAFLASLKGFEGICIVYESVYRIEKLLREIRATLPDRDIFIAREMTKFHGEYLIFSAQWDEKEFEEMLQKLVKKGEFTVILGIPG